MGDSGARKLSRRLETGPEEARLLTELERNGIAILALRRHRPLLSGFTDTQLHDLAHRLWRKGWLDRIESGKYVVVPRAARRGWSEHPFVVAEGIAPGGPDEHYVSYWSALSHHDLTEQLPRVVYVATLGVKKPELVYRGWRYRFVPLAESKFFGFAAEEFTALNGAARVEVRIAEPEKAIVDSLDHERFAGGIAEVAKAVRRGLEGQRVSVPRLVDCAVRFPNASVAARLGYLLERSGAATEAIEPLRAVLRRRGPPPFLSPRAPREDAVLDPGWYLRVNVPGGALDDSDLIDLSHAPGAASGDSADPAGRSGASAGADGPRRSLARRVQSAALR